MSKKFNYRIDFTAGGWFKGNWQECSYHIIITKNGYDYMEVYEDATPLVDKPDTKEEDWEISEQIKKIIEVLNANV